MAQNETDSVEVRFENETLLLTQKLMPVLLNCYTGNISLHLKNIFKSDELKGNSVIEHFSVTADDGKKYKTKPNIAFHI